MSVKRQLALIVAILLVFLALTVLIRDSFPLQKVKSNINLFGKYLTKQPSASLKIPILLYHYVEYNKDKRDFLRDSLNIPPHIFEAQIKTLQAAGYTFITPKNLPKLLDAPSADDKKYAILSFDDGYEDFYTDVFPILKKYNAPAVNYVVYNFIGRLNYLKESQIKELVESELIEIGSHTLNHTSLTGVNEQLAETEIEQSKKLLEKAFGVKIESFAYPYGFYNAQVKQMVRNAGYTTSVTIDAGNVVDKRSLLELKRVRPGYNIGKDLLFVLE